MARQIGWGLLLNVSNIQKYQKRITFLQETTFAISYCNAIRLNAPTG